MSVEFGKSYRDVITGIGGIAIGFTEYMTGCNQVLLSQEPDEKGNFRESIWFDEERLTELSTKQVSLIPKPNAEGIRPSGPDRPAPKK